MEQQVATYPCEHPGPTHSTKLISWLLMTWQRKEPGHQQAWYWFSTECSITCPHFSTRCQWLFLYLSSSIIGLHNESSPSQFRAFCKPALIHHKRNLTEQYMMEPLSKLICLHSQESASEFIFSNVPSWSREGLVCINWIPIEFEFHWVFNCS